MSNAHRLPSSPLQPDGTRRIVISIHGIRTHGEWQKTELTKVLNLHNFVHIPLDYGFFRATRLLGRKSRRKQIDWFRDEYTNHSRYSEGPPSIIAHSFGTYLVARAMEIYEEIKFDRIILCGSIVNQEYDWSARFNNGQCTAVLNDYGQVDAVASKAKYVMEDAGDSGVKGFKNPDNIPNVVQRTHPEWRHSDFFYQLNYEKNWIPFLEGSDPQKLTSADRPSKRRKNRHFRTVRAIVVFAIFCALATGLYGIWRYLAPSPIETATVSFPQMAEVYKSTDYLEHLDSYREKYMGKRVNWEAQIIQPVDSDAFQIAPLPVEHAEFKVVATYNPDNFDPPLRNGRKVELGKGIKVKIVAIIDDVSPRGTRLRGLEVVDYIP